MRGEDEGYECFNEVEAIAETDKALLCLINNEEVWIPKSVIGDDSEVYERGDVGKLVVAEWFARKEL